MIGTTKDWVHTCWLGDRLPYRMLPRLAGGGGLDPEPRREQDKRNHQGDHAGCDGPYQDADDVPIVLGPPALPFEPRSSTWPLRLYLVWICVPQCSAREGQGRAKRVQPGIRATLTLRMVDAAWDNGWPNRNCAAVHVVDQSLTGRHYSDLARCAS